MQLFSLRVARMDAICFPRSFSEISRIVLESICVGIGTANVLYADAMPKILRKNVQLALESPGLQKA